MPCPSFYLRRFNISPCSNQCKTKALALSFALQQLTMKPHMTWTQKMTIVLTRIQADRLEALIQAMPSSDTEEEFALSFQTRRRSESDTDSSVHVSMTLTSSHKQCKGCLKAMSQYNRCKRKFQISCACHRNEPPPELIGVSSSYESSESAPGLIEVSRSSTDSSDSSDSEPSLVSISDSSSDTFASDTDSESEGPPGLVNVSHSSTDTCSSDSDSDSEGPPELVDVSDSATDTCSTDHEE